MGFRATDRRWRGGARGPWEDVDEAIGGEGEAVEGEEGGPGRPRLCFTLLSPLSFGALRFPFFCFLLLSGGAGSRRKGSPSMTGYVGR